MGKRGITNVAMLVAVAGAVVALAVPASASLVHASGDAGVSVASKTVKFGSCHNAGKFAYCSSTGTVNHPLSIQFHVQAAPGQRVEGSWAMTCAKGTHGGHKGGLVKGRAPQVKPLRMPLSAPDSCSVSANAQLTKSGTIRTYLTATVSG